MFLPYLSYNLIATIVFLPTWNRINSQELYRSVEATYMYLNRWIQNKEDKLKFFSNTFPKYNSKYVYYIALSLYSLIQEWMKRIKYPISNI